MTETSGYKVNPKRSASNSIRGYVYQIYQSVLAWIELKEHEVLALERAEDFDVHVGTSIVGTQVKDLSDNLTLRSQDVIDTLNNFWFLRQSNPTFDVALRFLTTATPGTEQSSPFGPGKKGLEYWRDSVSERLPLEPLRGFLLTLDLQKDLKSFIKSATTTELYDQLISRIQWDLGSKSKDALESQIQNKLKLHGSRLGVNTHHSCHALPHLLKKVADLVSTSGERQLTYADFLTAFDEATTESIPRGQLEALRSKASSYESKKEALLVAKNPTTIEVSKLILEHWAGDNEDFVTVELTNTSELPANHIRVEALRPSPISGAESERMVFSTSAAFQMYQSTNLSLAAGKNMRLPIGAKSEFARELNIGTSDIKVIGAGMTPNIPDDLIDKYLENSITYFDDDGPIIASASIETHATPFCLAVKYTSVLDQEFTFLVGGYIYCLRS